MQDRATEWHYFLASRHLCTDNQYTQDIRINLLTKGNYLQRLLNSREKVQKEHSPQPLTQLHRAQADKTSEYENTIAKLQEALQNEHAQPNYAKHEKEKEAKKLVDHINNINSYLRAPYASPFLNGGWFLILSTIHFLRSRSLEAGITTP